MLTQLSIFWFDFLRDVTPTHFLTANVDEYPEPLRQYRDQLEGRSMLVKRAKMIEIECVARGYISGSGWKEYQQHGTVCGIQLPAGLRESDKLPEPIFTPATKAQTGHDENISFEHVLRLIGEDLAQAAARSHARHLHARRGLRGDQGHHHRRHQVRVRLRGRRTGAGRRSADARFFALLAGGDLQAGRRRSSPSTSSSCATTWNRFTGTSSRRRRRLPEEVAAKTGEKYRQAYQVLTGREL